MKLKLTARQRQQLYEALMSAFPDHEALERLASLGLDAQLNLISKGQTYSAIVLSMINHYENTVGQLDKLIEAARMMNPINPEFGTFYEHVWLRLKSQNASGTSSRKQRGTQQHQNSAITVKEKGVTTPSDTPKQQHTTSTGVKEKSEPTHDDTPEQQHGEEQEKQKIETPGEKAHNHVSRARTLLQQVYDMFELEERPFEERPHEDECSLATEHVNNANGAVLLVPSELKQAPTSNAKAYYELEEKRTYFSDEVGQVIRSITNFSQPPSVIRQKDIQTKIGSLQRILKDIDSLIDQFSNRTD